MGKKTHIVSLSLDSEAYNLFQQTHKKNRSKFICDLIKNRKERKKMLQQQKKDLIAQANWIQQIINDLDEVK